MRQKINNFSMRRLRLSEFFAYHMRVIELIKENEDLDLTALSGNYEYCFEEFDKVYVKASSTSYTKQIIYEDNRRSEAWSCLHAQIKNYLKHPDPQMVLSAEILFNIFSKYKNPTLQSYDEETGLTYNLIQELEIPANMAHINKLNCKPWFDLLKESTYKFENLVIERNKINSEVKKNIVDTARKNLEKAYDDFIYYFNCTVGIKSTTILIKFLNEVNGLVDAAKKKIKTRQTRAKNKKDKTDGKGDGSGGTGDSGGDGDDDDDEGIDI